MSVICRRVKLKSKHRATEVDGQFEIPQEVSAENPALLEPGGLVYCAKIQNQRAQIALLHIRYPAFANEEHLHVFRYAGCASHIGGLAFDYLIHEVQSPDCRG
jgi:hypothetical protein